MTNAKVSASDRDIGGNSRSREIHRGAMKKARVGRALGFGEVKRAQRAEDTHQGKRDAA